MLGRAVVVIVVLAATAFAHRNTGTYRVARAEELEVGTPRGVPFPRCTPAPQMPESLVIVYAGPDAPTVDVNGSAWRLDGLTTDPSGKHVSRPPMRTADDPEPPSNTGRTVSFRRDGGTADAILEVIEIDPVAHQVRCATAYRYRGTFTP